MRSRQVADDLRRVFDLVREHTTEQPPDGMEPEREVDDDAEVATAASERPEQVAVLALARAHDVTGRRHDGRADQIVERQPVETDEMADAAAEGQTGDAGVAEGAARRGEPVAQARRIEILPERAAATGCRPLFRIDRDTAHQPQVDDERTVAHAVPGNAVAAAAYSDRQLVLDGVGDRGHDVVHVERPHDQLGPPVDHPVECDPRGFIAGVVGSDHRPAVALPQIRENGGGHLVE